MFCNTLSTTGSFCGYKNIGVGGQCGTTQLNTCQTGLDCTANVCTPKAIGVACTRYAAMVLGASTDMSNCINTAFCNAVALGSGTCVAKLTAGTNVSQSDNNEGAARAYAVCASGFASNILMNYNSGQYQCRAVGAWIGDGLYCQSNDQCTSGYCRTKYGDGAALATCATKNTVPLGSYCQWATSTAGANIECASGFCSTNSSSLATGQTVRTCISGTVNGVAPGGACYNDDQCSINSDTYAYQRPQPHACVKPDYVYTWGTTGVCNGTVVGRTCYRDSLGSSLCTSNANGASLSCQCASDVNTCQAVAATTITCPTQATALVALAAMYPGSISTSSAVTTLLNFAGMVAAVGSSTEQSTAASYVCCTACNTYGISSAVTTNAAYAATQLVDKSLTCSNNAWTAFTTAQNTARCVTTRNVVTAGTSFGTCPASNTSAGVAVGPSVALVVAIIAVVLALFA
jgi:hypothetical protein